MSVSLSFKRGDIIVYLRRRLAADTTRDAMDSTLEVDIMKKIPNDISEMYSSTVLALTACMVQIAHRLLGKNGGGGQPFRFLIILPVETVVSVLLEQKGNCDLYGATERNRYIQTGS